MTRRAWMVAAAMATIGAGVCAWGQDAVDLQRALDRPVNVSIANAPIANVFDRLTAETGVKFLIDEDTLEYLPYGGQTRLAMTIRNATLRKALTPTLDQPGLLAPQALRWEVSGDAIRVLPAEALYRLGRRATYDELAALGMVYSTKLLAVEEGGGALEQIRKATGIKDLKLVFKAVGDKDDALKRANAILPATGADWLDQLTHGQDWTWYLAGQEIIVLDKKEQVARQLGKVVSLKYQNAELMTVLLDLARKARLQLAMDPGVLNLLSAQVRTNFNLVMADATVAQALEVISGATGLVFVRTGQGIRVEPSEKLSADAGGATTRPRARFFVRMTMPGPGGTEVEVYLRSDELPADLVDRIDRQKQTLIDQMRGPASQTQPATPSAAGTDRLH